MQAFISLSPVNRYHVLVVPRTHYEHFVDLPHETLVSAMAVAQLISGAIATVAKPDAISVLSDDDLTDSGFNLVAHWKLHLIPRYENDAIVIDWKREADPGPEVRAGYCSALRQELGAAQAVRGKASV